MRTAVTVTATKQHGLVGSYTLPQIRQVTFCWVFFIDSVFLRLAVDDITGRGFRYTPANLAISSSVMGDPGLCSGIIYNHNDSIRLVELYAESIQYKSWKDSKQNLKVTSIILSYGLSVIVAIQLVTTKTEITTRSKTIFETKIGFAEFFYTECWTDS